MFRANFYPKPIDAEYTARSAHRCWMSTSKPPGRRFLRLRKRAAHCRMKRAPERKNSTASSNGQQERGPRHAPGLLEYVQTHPLSLHRASETHRSRSFWGTTPFRWLLKHRRRLGDGSSHSSNMGHDHPLFAHDVGHDQPPSRTVARSERGAASRRFAALAEAIHGTFYRTLEPSDGKSFFYR